MPPRKSSANTTLAAGLPDEPRNGLSGIPAGFRKRGRRAGSIYVVAELTQKDLDWSYELGADKLTMQIASIQIPADQALVEKILRETEEHSIGETQLPYGEAPTDGQAERRAALQQAVLDWCTSIDGDPRDRWEEYFGAEAPTGPHGADLHHLVEFADRHGVTVGETASETEDHDTAEDDEEPPTEQAAADDDEEIARGEDDARHAVASVPGPEWRSAEQGDWDESRGA